MRHNKLYRLCLISLLLSVQLSHAALLRDPTRPTGYIGDENANPWQLNAIILSSDRRIAIIGENVVKVGDEIAGQKIISIRSNSVTLEGPEGKMELNLVDKTTKQRSDD